MNHEYTDEQKQELADIQNTFTAASKLADGLRAELHTRKEDDAIRVLINEAGPWVAPNAATGAAKLLRNQLKLDDNGQLIATSEEGHTLINGNGETMTAKELVSVWRKTHPNFVKQAYAPAPAKESPAESDEHLRQLFGRVSDTKYANRFAADDIVEYRRLKVIARERKILL